MPASSPSKDKDDRPPPSRSASETSSAHSGDCSDRDFDTSTQVMSSRTEEYRLLFHLPRDEVLIQDFNCALQENILLQGHMYLFVHHICFYSNIFGFETKKIIAFHEVTCIKKAKTAAIFPNAIEIVSGEKKHLFGSFFYRDEAYKLIIDGWAQHCSDAKALLDRQESESDNNSHENASVMLERATESESLPDNSSSTDMSKDAINSDEKPLPNDKNESEGSEKLLDQDNEDRIPDAPSSIEPLNWQPEDIDAPQIPQHFAMIAEAKFQISVEEFFTLFISDCASDFLEILRKRCGHKDLQYTSWHEHEQYGHARELSYLHPIKVYFGAKSSRCQELQKFRVYRNSHLVIETSQQVSGVPYSDYFTVEGIWDVEKNGNEEKGCILRVYISVPFSKKTIFKGKIEQTTREEIREGFTIWINSAHELLKRKKMEKLEGNASQSTSMIQDQELGIGSCSKEEILTRDLHLTATPATVPEKGPDMENFDPQIDNPVQETFGHSASFRDSLATFVSYINSRSQFLLYLVLAVVAILIVMQIIIIVLLSRGPQVHFVTPSLDTYGSEDIGWLERHIGYLKEEVLMLETRMERMRLEQAMVKTHLLNLERLKPKS